MVRATRRMRCIERAESCRRVDRAFEQRAVVAARGGSRRSSAACVELRVGLAGARELPVARGDDAGAHVCARFAVRRVVAQGVRRQRAAPRHAGRCDRAAGRTRARGSGRSLRRCSGSGRSDRRPSRRGRGSSRRRAGSAPGTRAARAAREIVDDARFERLAQHFQRVPVPFGQLVEEQHAVVRERDLARARLGAAADQRDRAGACGAARGTGARASAPASRPRPLTEATAAASSASASLASGSRPGRREASKVLPQPGGPMNSR